MKQPIDHDRSRVAKLFVESANSESFTEKRKARPMEPTLRTLPGRATGSHPRDSCTGRLRPLDFSDALCPSKGTPNPAAHRTAARVTRVFSVRPPRRYCQSGYSCLGCDQYGLDSQDDPDDDQLRRAIDWRMARIVRSTRKIAEAGIKRQLLSPEGINRAVFGDYSPTTVQSWFMGRKSRKLVG